MISRRSLLALDVRRAAVDDDQQWLRIHRTAMACRVEVTLPPGDRGHIPAALAALNEADRIESLLTLYRESSEVSRINRQAAAVCAGVDPEVLTLLERCAALSAATDGAFDITSTPLSRCWGFLSREPSVPDDADIERARGGVGMSRVTIDKARNAVAFDSDGVELNLNAVGKGYAVERMAEVLAAHGVRRALVSAGGSSVRALGGPSGGWRIDVRSPLLARPIARLYLRDAALGTSGAGEQFVVDNGTRFGHVIDPRSGRPATGVVSASVVAADAATADALSTAFLIGGPQLAERFCLEHPGTMAILVTEPSGTLRVFGGSARARLEPS